MVTQAIYKYVYLGFVIDCSVADTDALEVCVGWMMSLDLPEEPGRTGASSSYVIEAMEVTYRYGRGIASASLHHNMPGFAYPCDVVEPIPPSL